MSNTVIQVKRSTATNQPSAGSLSAGELAYSYTSNVAFIGTSGGNDVSPIGGQFYVTKTNSAYDIAIAAFGAANTGSIAGIAFDKANAANIIASLAFDKANSANVLAFNTGIGANAFASATIAGANTAVGAGANAYADIVGTGANNYLLTVVAGANTAVGAGANAFTSATIAGANTAVGTGANTYMQTTLAGANTAVGTGANTYAAAIGAASNTYLLAVIAGANSAVGAGANSVGSAAFDTANGKLSLTGGSLSGDLSITGNLSVTGNTSFISVENYRVSDPLIYLAGNNYTSDIVDIGFIANYVNATGSNVHTGLFRDHTSKEYYLFQGYDKEPDNNHIDPNGNNFTIAVLNSAIRTSNISLAGANLLLTLAGSNTAVGSGANAFASATIAGANTAVGTGANTYLLTVIAGANTAVGDGANAFTSATIAGANTAVGTGANTYLLTVIAGANTAVGTGANTYLLATLAGANTAVGAGANAYTTAFASDAANITSGTLVVGRGGTGVNTFANNGVLFGNTTSGIRVTAAGTEGQVLQATSQGTPTFAMLDGGSF